MHDDYLFIGSIVGPSVLLKTTRVEVDVEDGDSEMASALATVVTPADTMDLDDDDGRWKQATEGFYD